MSNTEMAYEWRDGRMCLVMLHDGYKLDPSWPYSATRNESLGGSRFQMVLSDDVSDEELGRRLRTMAGVKPGRETLVDIWSWTPTME